MTVKRLLSVIRLISPNHAEGFPCCARLRCVHAIATTPAQKLGSTLLKFPGCISLRQYCGQVGHCDVLFEDCSAFTRVRACTLGLPSYFLARLTGAFNHIVASISHELHSTGAIAEWFFNPRGKRPLSRRNPKNRGWRCPRSLRKLLHGLRDS